MPASRPACFTIADSGLGQVEVLRDLAHRPVAASAQLDDLGLELRGGR